MKLTEEEIAAMVDQMDCNAIHAFMVAKNWVWYRARDGVPSPQEIAAEGRRLLRVAAEFNKPGHYRVECGGIRAETDGFGSFEIMFIASRGYHDAGK